MMIFRRSGDLRQNASESRILQRNVVLTDDADLQVIRRSAQESLLLWCTGFLRWHSFLDERGAGATEITNNYWT